MRWFSILVIALLIACNSEPSPFDALEKEVEANPTNANVSELLDAYQGWLNENPDRSTERKEILLKTHDVSEKHIRYTTQVPVLKELILEYPDDPETVDRLIEYADIQSKLRRETAALVTRQMIALNYAESPKVEQLYTSIPAGAPSADSALIELGRAMFNDQTLRINPQVAREYIAACEGYALANPEDTMAVENLHKAAETARSLDEIDHALAIYDWILEKYPDHKRTPQALFLKAFTYDSNLKDFEKASLYYTEFLDKYPDDQFAQSATFLLENLGKDDEELLKRLREKSEEGEEEPTM